MGRIFSFISIVVVLMTMLASAGVFYLAQTRDNQLKDDAIYGLAKGIALSISTRTQLLSASLDKIAQSPELIQALNQSDLPRAKALVQQMSTYLPDAMVFRLLLSTDNKPDNTTIPYVGYADLDLVKNTFKQPQLPLVQGELGAQRHLAITCGIKSDGQVIAVILASVKLQDLQNSFKFINDQQMYVELRQADVVLFANGSAEIKSVGKHTEFIVKDTAWTISYWFQYQLDLTLLQLVLAVIGVSGMLSCLACLIAFRKLNALLLHDQKSILHATKDLIEGNADGNYPVHLQVMRSFISTIVQMKHESLATGVNTLSAPELSGSRDYSEDSPFLSSQLPGIVVKDAAKEEVDSMGTLPEFSAEKQQLKKEFKTEIPPLPLVDRHIKAEAKIIKPTDVIFRAYDIRGIVEKTLTSDIVYDIGRALGSEAMDKGIATLVMAKDGRLSSPELSKVLADGILSTGIDILDIGTVPTPVLYFVAHHHDSNSGVMLTGSHNPANYNGLKIVLAGETLAGESIQRLKNRIDRDDLYDNEPGKLSENSMFTNEYISVITEDIRISRPMKVVIDAGNGVAGEIAPVLFRALGCEVIELFCNIDGSFPNHHPDPSNPKNLVSLIAAVEENQADVGLAFDGDGDRLGVIDSFGNIIWPDRQMMLFSQAILAKKPGSEIIYDVKCSRNLPAQIIRNGGTPTIWKTGHSLMKAKLKETGAIFAGEMSGHLFFNDRWLGFDDGLYSAARLIEILSEDAKTSAMVFAEFPNSPCTPELSIALDEGENVVMMEQILASKSLPEDGRITDIDGLRIDFIDGFGLVRASNTTPALIVRFEGETEEILLRIQDQFRQLILEVNPEIALPF